MKPSWGLDNYHWHSAMKEPAAAARCLELSQPLSALALERLAVFRGGHGVELGPAAKGGGPHIFIS